MNRRHVLRRFATWTAIGIALVWTLFPLYWALIYSIKPTSLEYRSVYLPFVDFHPTLEHWRWEWAERHQIDGLQDGLANSLLIAVATAAGSVGLGISAAAGFAAIRRQGGGTGWLSGLAFIPRVVPPVAIATPIYLLSVSTRVHDTLLALIVIHSAIALPLAVLVIDSALREFPRDVWDAARLDGAGRTRIAWEIVAPLLAPMMLAVGLLSFAASWDEFLFAEMNYASSAFTAPISIAFLQDRDGIAFTHVGSHLVLILLPPLVLLTFMQRFLVRGLSLGAVRDDR